MAEKANMGDIKKAIMCTPHVCNVIEMGKKPREAIEQSHMMEKPHTQERRGDSPSFCFAEIDKIFIRYNFSMFH
jgi:hypothetical protein